MANDLDIQLVRRFQAGDRRAFDALVRAWDRCLFALAHRLIGDRHEAEDVRQEAWVRCHLQLGKLREPAQFPAWIARIVVNLCRDRRRSKTPRDRAGQMPAVESATPLSACEQAETAAIALAALARLPPREREIVALRIVQGLSFDQIAALLHRPRSSVQLVFCRSLSALARSVRVPSDVTTSARSSHAV
ncbi:MAG: sigma-70 family RNA polymerase sigma factor [Planctomycetota bacterium]